MNLHKNRALGKKSLPKVKILTTNDFEKREAVSFSL
jgi:hypothetical protein